MVRTVLFSLWLPLLVVAISALRFGPDMAVTGPGLGQVLLMFGLAWPSAIPLTLAVRLLHRRSRVLAYLCAVVLGLLSALAVMVGGLLGPVGVVGYTVAASVPAWILLGILAVVQRGGGVKAQRA